MACGMECGVSLDNAGNNPGAVLAWASGVGTGTHHLLKGTVHADFATTLGAKLQQRAAQRAVQSKLLRAQHHTRVGAPP